MNGQARDASLSVPPHVAAARFSRRYGQPRLAELLSLFAKGERASAIAKRFGVKRQAVWKWKQQFGTEKTVVRYQPHPEVEALANPARSVGALV